DVVHFHHSLLAGAELLYFVRRELPTARIVFTFHDYYAICANDGLMVTTADQRLCNGASPDACHRCFPDLHQSRFVLRETFLKHMFRQVDSFVSPSEFLKQRYAAWGLPAERISVVRNGIHPVEPAPHRTLPPNGRRDRFAFFGHINAAKGALLTIKAAQIL